MRKIAVVTGSRADYGLFVPLLRLLDRDPDMELQLIVSAAHLSPEFGLTKRFIEADGFSPAAEVEMLLPEDTPLATAKSVGMGCIGFGDAFARLKPDMVVLLGDRFETLAAATTAMFFQIPLAHLHGGEVTEGAFDEAIRHSITKMAHLHFVAAESFRNRVLQLGEDPEHVFTVGAIGLDNLEGSEASLLSRDEVAAKLDVDLGSPLFLATYHPATLSKSNPVLALRNMFEALEGLPDATTVLTYANSDTFGRALIEEIKTYAKTHPRIVARSSLGQRLYLSTMRFADCVIGNSSSGLIEAPSLGVPTVNIGPRQKGRISAASVINCDEDRAAISAAIARALSQEFREQARQTVNPYGDGKTAARIHQHLRDAKLEGLLMKSFHDLDFSENKK